MREYGGACGVKIFQFCLIFGFLVACGMPCLAKATSTPNVYFSGVAFTGNASDIPSEFPHLSRAIDSTMNGRINAQIRDLLKHHPTKLKVLFDQLGSIDDAAQSTALALGLDRETTSVVKIGDVYKVRLEISMQLLFFDFKEKQVLGGFPVIMDYIDTKSTAPTEEEIQNDFNQMVMGSDRQHSIADEFVAELALVSVPSPSSKHLRVSSVELDPKAREYLAHYAPTVDANILKGQLAQEFGKYLATNLNLSILPYASNQALGGSMAARFVEGEAFQLKIPEADYSISLAVAGFKKVEQGHNNVSKGYLYGAFVDLAVTEPLSGKVFFSQRIKQGAVESVPVTQANTDDWAAASDTLRLLFNNFTLALSNPAEKWSASALPSGSTPQKEFNALRGLVQSCR